MSEYLYRTKCWLFRCGILSRKPQRPPQVLRSLRNPYDYWRDRSATPVLDVILKTMIVIIAFWLIFAPLAGQLLLCYALFFGQKSP